MTNEDLHALVDQLMQVMDESCHHCGRMPEPDGDHTCLCPLADGECFKHVAEPVLSRNAVREALLKDRPR